jgi:protease-4
MDANRICTSPFSVTGSIGVIGGWVWNKGLGEKLGLTSDHVQVGPSADLMGGLTIPFTDIRIPERNLNDHEREVAKRTILELYDDFTRKVATARGLTPDRVREIAEGRVYMGREAQRLKLVDEVATLDETIEAARRAAGIPANRRIRVIEYPRPSWFTFPTAMRWIGLRASEAPAAAPASGAPLLSYDVRAVRMILGRAGQPLLLTPASLLPDENAPER